MDQKPYDLIQNSIFYSAIKEFNKDHFQNAVEIFDFQIKEGTFFESDRCHSALNIALIETLGLIDGADPIEILKYINTAAELDDRYSKLLNINSINVNDVLNNFIESEISSKNLSFGLISAFSKMIGIIDNVAVADRNCLLRFLCEIIKEARCIPNTFIYNFVFGYFHQDLIKLNLDSDDNTRAIIYRLSKINEYLIELGHTPDNIAYVNMLVQAYIINKYLDDKYYIRLPSIEHIKAEKFEEDEGALSESDEFNLNEYSEENVNQYHSVDYDPTYEELSNIKSKKKEIIEEKEDNSLKNKKLYELPVDLFSNPIMGLAEFQNIINEIEESNVEEDKTIKTKSEIIDPNNTDLTENGCCEISYPDCIKTCIIQCENTFFNVVHLGVVESVLSGVISEIKNIIPDIEIIILSRCTDLHWTVAEEILNKLPIDRIIRNPRLTYRGLLEELINNSSLDLSRTCLVGPDEESIRLAYEFGLLSVLQKTNWQKPNYYAKSYCPDFEYSEPSRLLEYLKDPNAFKPSLEQILDGTFKYPKFIETKRFSTLESHESVTIYGLGRHFSGYKSLTARRERHLLTQSIHENKDSKKFPESWVQAITTFIKSKKLGQERSLLVVSIPARPGRIDRLSYLCSQVMYYSNDLRIDIEPNLLYYKNGIKSNSHEYLNREERFKNIKEHLEVMDLGPLMETQMTWNKPDVLIIDDVATSGASMFYAKKKLKEAGFDNIYCLAIGVNISK